MKYIISIIFLFCAFQSQAQHDMNKMPGMKMPSVKKETKKPVAKKAATTSTKIIYTCPMHPQIQKEKPGNCPICGMTLVKKTIMAIPVKTVYTKVTTPATKVIYTCPMHPQIQKDKPGNCPICGMTLVRKTIKTPVKATPKKEDIKTTVDTSHMNMQMDKDTGMHDMHNMDIDKNADPLQPVSYTCPMHPQVHSPKPGNCPICGMKLVKEKPKAVVPSYDGMQMSKESSKMDMTDKSDNMNNIALAKGNLGPVKTIANINPPRTVTYHLYIRDTVVTYGKKAKRAIAVNGQIPM
ncbi:MAG TPA: heavy metal-binding domain-containing protein, partial [Ferruginibacter sp.]|nr:heavy metal-binding domain-containing protein [Ferruginibacter sp.]